MGPPAGGHNHPRVGLSTPTIDANAHPDRRLPTLRDAMRNDRACGMQFILVRHAQTASNVDGRIDTQMPGGPITERGRAEAEEIAAELSGRRIAHVAASPAIRTQQTAAPIAAHFGLEVETIDDLREIAFGDELEGRNDKEALAICERVFGEWAAGNIDEHLPGGENWRMVETRMRRGLEGLVDAGAAGDVVAVSHAGSLRVLVASLVGPTAADSAGYLKNAGYLIITVEDGEWRLQPPDASQLMTTRVEELRADARE
jgi:probable phosphoglycerate mutase